MLWKEFCWFWFVELFGSFSMKGWNATLPVPWQSPTFPPRAVEIGAPKLPVPPPKLVPGAVPPNGFDVAGVEPNPPGLGGCCPNKPPEGIEEPNPEVVEAAGVEPNPPKPVPPDVAVPPPKRPPPPVVAGVLPNAPPGFWPNALPCVDPKPGWDNVSFFIRAVGRVGECDFAG